MIQFSDNSVHDFGDLNFHKIEKDEPYMDVNFPRNVGAANKMLSSAVSRAIGAGYTLIMLGGDHRWYKNSIYLIWIGTFMFRCQL